MNQYNLIDEYGNQVWYLDTEDRSADVSGGIIGVGILLWHREDGPAYINACRVQIWCINGKRHRLDGPAVINPDGNQSWWVNGIWCRNNKSFQKAAKLTDEEMTFIVMKYGNVK